MTRKNPLRFDVTFPKIDNLPDPDENLMCVSFNADYAPLLAGFLSFLRGRYAYLDDIPENYDKASRLIRRLQGECNMLADVQDFDGELKKRFCGDPTWYPITQVMRFAVRQNGQSIQFDLDGDGDWDVTQNFFSSENTFNDNIPFADIADQFCRASWGLARVLCREFQKIALQIKITENVSASIAQSLAELLPPLALIDDNIELITQDLPQAVLEFIQEGSGSETVIKKVAEQIYCSLQKNYPDHLDDVIDDIPLGLYQPIFDILEFRVTVSWINFTDIAQSIYDTATLDYVQYLVIGYAKSAMRGFLEFSGIYKSQEKIMQGLLASAVFMDSRDCDDFHPCDVWCYQWNFLENDGGWEVISGTNSLGLWTVGVGWQNQPWVSVPANRNLNIKYTFPADVAITDIEMTYVITDLGDPDSGINLSCGGGEFSMSVGNHNEAIEVEFFDNIIAINSNFVRRGLAVKTILFRGNGNLPEGFSGGVVCAS